ncbi:MAG: DUF6290 family protein [Candidatus Nanohaloarchaea archaeon]
MGTVSVRMPDEEIRKLEDLARRKGKTRSGLLRELAEEKISENSIEVLENLVGVLDASEAEKFEETVGEARSEMEESIDRGTMREFGIDN